MLKMKRSFVVFLCLIAVCLLFVITGCKKKKSEIAAAKSDEKEFLIGFSIDSFVIERWRRDCDVFMSAAKEKNASVIVQNAGNNVEEQIKQIKYLIDRNVDVLVIVPKDSDALTDVVQKAHSKGIKVISYDRLIRNAPIDLYVTINSRNVGVLMAEELFRLKPYGSWFCLYGAPEDFNMKLISDGVHSVLDKKPSVSIGLEYYTDGWNYDLSYQKMSEMLAHGNVPEAVICGNDAIAESVLRAISESRVGKRVYVSGQDADIAGCQRVVEGTQALTVYKPITLLARKAADCAIDLIYGKSADSIDGVSETINNGFSDIPVFYLEPQLVTAENIDDVIIKNGFHTHEEMYRNVSTQ